MYVYYIVYCILYTGAYRAPVTCPLGVAAMRLTQPVI